VTGARGRGAAPRVVYVRCRPAEARAQAAWIVEMEPWRGLGYRAAPLGRWLARAARDHAVWVARTADVSGIVVLETPFLLGGFISLLAVRAAAAGRGLGRALVARTERQIFEDDGKRWLYVSADAGNRAALGFYRALDFTRVGRLPDLIRDGRTEVLLRKKRPL
jgi:ribosomal protein S18 acetylase RimI-like enzyme